MIYLIKINLKKLVENDRVVCQISHRGRDYLVRGIFKSRKSNYKTFASRKRASTPSSSALEPTPTRLKQSNQSYEDETESESEDEDDEEDENKNEDNEEDENDGIFLNIN